MRLDNYQRITNENNEAIIMSSLVDDDEEDKRKFVENKNKSTPLQ